MSFRSPSRMSSQDDDDDDEDARPYGEESDYEKESDDEISPFVFSVLDPKTKFESRSTLNQISPGSFSPPTDVTLKLSDGSIDAHKMILAAVSPVFERMFCGKSKKVALPTDSYKVMKLLVDFVYNGSFELDSLTDFGSLMEVADRYQINKVLLKQLCGECVLSKLDPSNFSVLLPTYASLMNEESCKKAADKVVSFTDSNLRHSFSKTKELPEDIILPLLQSSDVDCSESELFSFLVDWYEYQTDVLQKSLNRTPQIFRCIRYSLIIPQILSFKVASCDLVDTRLLAKAHHYIYSSCTPLGQYSTVDDRKLIEQCSRKVIRSSKVDWFGNDGVSMEYNEINKCKVSFTAKKLPSASTPNQYVLKSSPLEDGIYSFDYEKLTSRYSSSSDQINITDESKNCLYTHPLKNNSLISVFVENHQLFLKLINDDEVQSTATVNTTTSNSFRVCICNLSSDRQCTFYIKNHVY